MSDSIKVSVIIPVFNVEKYLHRCLDTLANQTLQDIEVILIDDGSTDNSKKICEEYLLKNKNFKLLSQENRGQANARNSAIGVAQGQYIGFVDSDDWIDENYFEKLYTAAVSVDADIACAGFIKKGKNKNKIRLKFENQEVFENVEDKLLATKFLREPCIWNKIYKRQLFFEYNIFLNEGLAYDDGLFSLKLLYNSKKLITVPNTNYYYFANPKSVVNTWDEKKYNDLFCSKNLVLNFLRDNNIKIKKDSFLITKKSLSIFGLPIFEMRESIATNNFYLFRILPIFKTKFVKKYQPLISVITITKNLIEAGRKKDLIRCLNSVHNQSYSNIEHIIIDGASDDGTLELLQEYRDKGYIKYFSEEDNGIYNAFNKGLDKANGEYIAFLNSDDYWHKFNAIEKVISQMQDKNADFSFAPARLVSEYKVRVQKGKIYANFTRMPVCHQTVFVKTQVLKDIGGFDEKFKLAGDYDVFFKLLENKYKYTRINYLFTSFFAGGASSNSDKMTQECLTIMEEKLNKKFSFTKEQVEEIFNSQALPLIVWKEALSCFNNLNDKLNFIIMNTKNHIKKRFTKKS